MKKVGCGSCTTYAILEDGSGLAWGMATNLQLTNGDDDQDEWEPIPLSGKKLEEKKVRTPFFWANFDYFFLPNFPKYG